MTIEEANTLMEEMIKSPNLRKHGYAVEAIMRDLCKYLRDREVSEESKGSKESEVEFDEEEWAIVGLLHDADYELIEKDPTKHTLVTEEKLREKGFNNERIISAIKAHHDGIKETRDNIMESSVYAADELSGLITACALVQPDKKISQVTVEGVLKKFKQPSFAAGARRDQITTGISELKIPLEEFTTIALKSMQKISDKLGL